VGLFTLLFSCLVFFGRVGAERARVACGGWDRPERPQERGGLRQGLSWRLLRVWERQNVGRKRRLCRSDGD
jgi:hypothetical protein